MSEICHARLVEAQPRAETSDHRVAKDSARNQSSRRQAPASLRRGARLCIELRLRTPPYGPKPSSETPEHPRQAPAAPPPRCGARLRIKLWLASGTDMATTVPPRDRSNSSPPNA